MIILFVKKLMYKSALTDRDAFGYIAWHTRSHGTYSSNLNIESEPHYFNATQI